MTIRAARGERMMERTLQALLDSLPLGVLLLDRGGRVTRFKERFKGLGI